MFRLLSLGAVATAGVVTVRLYSDQDTNNSNNAIRRMFQYERAPTPAAPPASSGSKFFEFPVECDVCVVGGGIVGLATAREISLRYPSKKVVVVEKEGQIAQHQTGHNSGVIHAGIYYKPGSTMARCCVQGAAKMYEYCEKKKIPYDRCGKLIVAVDEKEHVVLQKLLENGTANGVQGLELLTREQVKAIEPYVDVHSALNSPNTGVVDYAVVARSFAEDFKQKNGTIKLNFEVRGFKQAADGKVEVSGCEPGQNGPTKIVRATNVITCAGLQSDRVAILGGGSTDPKILPFRGTYYEMKPEFRNIVKRNIYPIPSGGGIPVGVHFTPTVNESRGRQMIIGPGACLAFSREGYQFFDIKLKDLWSTLTNVGLWTFAVKNVNLALGEMYRDLNKKAFLAQAQKLVPSLTEDMVQESFSGVMANVFDTTGKAAAEFIFERNLMNGTTLHVRNAPSPACTASLAIADEVVKVASEDFKWK